MFMVHIIFERKQSLKCMPPLLNASGVGALVHHGISGCGIVIPGVGDAKLGLGVTVGSLDLHVGREEIM